MNSTQFSARQLLAMADEMSEFVNGLKMFLEVSESTPMMAILNSWEVPVVGRDQEWRDRRDSVDALAGAAQSGIEVTGSFIRSRDERGEGVTLNVVASWAHITQPKAMFDRSDLLSVAQQAEGRLRHEAEQRDLASIHRSGSGFSGALNGEYPSYQGKLYLPQ